MVVGVRGNSRTVLVHTVVFVGVEHVVEVLSGFSFIKEAVAPVVDDSPATHKVLAIGGSVFTTLAAAFLPLRIAGEVYQTFRYSSDSLAVFSAAAAAP